MGDRLGVTLFATIDHAAGARVAGLELPDEVVLDFGDPAVGTALMQADPRLALTCPCSLSCGSRTGRGAQSAIEATSTVPRNPPARRR